MRKSLIRNLLDRRVPQILGSYFVGSTTLILFVDWLVKEFGFAEYFSSIALFGLISILPSVVILAYFHGAPGKDQWTRIEKIGIPINILFIGFIIFKNLSTTSTTALKCPGLNLPHNLFSKELIFKCFLIPLG